MSGYENKKSTIADTVFSQSSYISVSCLWTIISIAFSFSWYVGGAVILMGPLYGLSVLIYQTAVKKRRMVMPFTILAAVYSAYIMMMHAVHGEFFSHGVGDILTAVFFIACLISMDGEELKKTVEKVSHSLLWITIFYAVVSIFFTYVVTREDVLIIENDFIRDSFYRWSTPDPHVNRMNGLSGNPNPTGSWVVYGLMFGTLYLIIKNEVSLFDIALHLIAALLTLFVVFGTGSRDAILTLAVFGFVFIILYFVFFRKYMSKCSRVYLDICIAIVVFAVIVFMLVFLFSNSMRRIIFELMRIESTEDMTFMESLKFISESLQYASTRDLLRKETLDIWETHKMWGVSTQAVVESYTYPDIPAQCGSHNTYIQILATTGIPGIILHAMLWMISAYYAFVYAMKGKDRRLRTLSVYIFVLMPAVFFNNLYENYLYTNIELMVLMGFFMFALAAQLGHIRKVEKLEKSEDISSLES